MGCRLRVDDHIANGIALRACVVLLTLSYLRCYDRVIEWTHSQEYRSRRIRLVHGCKAVGIRRMLF